MILDVKELTLTDLQSFLQHAVAPRPICLASTINRNGDVNLSPFSFFNLFSIHPPLVIFSPSRRVRDNTTKHTLQNVQEVPEVVINMVDYSMVQQVSLSSCEYPAGVNEFTKAGLTMEPAIAVLPPMVQESKVKLECRVQEIIALGKEAGAGNLVLAEVLHIHINETVMNEQGKIDQQKLDLVARLGGDFYSRTNESSLFTVPKPNVALGIGMEELPTSVRHSQVLTKNHLAQLANVTTRPTIDPLYEDDFLDETLARNPEAEYVLHCHAKTKLEQGKVDEAWQILLRCCDTR